MKFEDIKSNAKRVFIDQINEVISGSTSQARAELQASLIRFAKTEGQELSELGKFAREFPDYQGDRVGSEAKHGNTAAQVALRAREEGIKLIDRWDVRGVGRLIDLFPKAVPASYRDKQLSCYMADNANSDWMVEVVGPRIELDEEDVVTRGQGR